MSVQIVTDSSSCLPAELAAEAGITVLDLHSSGEGEEATTASLSALELTAAYARLLERGGDDGVVALHLSKELSATWTNAHTAAAVFGDSVRVIDTKNAAMVVGYAALRAAEVARAGGSVENVARAAEASIAESSLWVYVHEMDALRRSGRLSTGQALMTTALATKPILQVVDGKLILAAKTRTQAKAMDKLVDMVRAVVVGAAQMEPTRSVDLAIHYIESAEQAEKLRARLEELFAELREAGEAAAPKGMQRTELPKAYAITAALQRTEPRVTWEEFPQVNITLVQISPVLQIHVGPGAIGVVAALR